MKATVCELPVGWMNTDTEREQLCRHLESEKTDLLLLPEMPFAEWLAGTRAPDAGAWATAVEHHGKWIERLGEFKVPMVAGTRPAIRDGKRLNVGFVWTREAGLREVHEKFYLPDEEGFWEASWYDRGDGGFELVEVNGLKIGFLICTELWYNHHARDYGKMGMHLLLCPRAVGSVTTDTWLAGGRAAANVSGAFCLSSNFSGPNTPEMNFGGTGWIIEPEEGFVMGTTSQKAPFLTLKIDLGQAEAAKSTYPRYVEDRSL